MYTFHPLHPLLLLGLLLWQAPRPVFHVLYFRRAQPCLESLVTGGGWPKSSHHQSPGEKLCSGYSVAFNRRGVLYINSGVYCSILPLHHLQCMARWIRLGLHRSSPTHHCDDTSTIDLCHQGNTRHRLYLRLLHGRRMALIESTARQPRKTDRIAVGVPEDSTQA